jgi:hypothetical protein
VHLGRGEGGEGDKWRYEVAKQKLSLRCRMERQTGVDVGGVTPEAMRPSEALWNTASDLKAAAAG